MFRKFFGALFLLLSTCAFAGVFPEIEDGFPENWTKTSEVSCTVRDTITIHANAYTKTIGDGIEKEVTITSKNGVLVSQLRMMKIGTMAMSYYGTIASNESTFSFNARTQSDIREMMKKLLEALDISYDEFKECRKAK